MAASLGVPVSRLAEAAERSRPPASLSRRKVLSTEPRRVESLAAMLPPPLSSARQPAMASFRCRRHARLSASLGAYTTSAFTAFSSRKPWWMPCSAS